MTAVYGCSAAVCVPFMDASLSFTAAAVPLMDALLTDAGAGAGC